MRTANLMGEFARGQSSEGRASKREAILPNRLRLALSGSIQKCRKKPSTTPIRRSRANAAQSIHRANAEIHELLRDGVKVEIRGPDGARIKETVRVIDWERREK